MIWILFCGRDCGSRSAPSDRWPKMALAHHGSDDHWWQRWPEATSLSAGSRSGYPRPADPSVEPMKVVPSSLPGFMDPVK
eukprot:6998134-Lingulodinium_polyedra.AAC.1